MQIARMIRVVSVLIVGLFWGLPVQAQIKMMPVQVWAKYCTNAGQTWSRNLTIDDLICFQYTMGFLDSFFNGTKYAGTQCRHDTVTRECVAYDIGWSEGNIGRSIAAQLDRCLPRRMSYGSVIEMTMDEIKRTRPIPSSPVALVIGRTLVYRLCQ